MVWQTAAGTGSYAGRRVHHSRHPAPTQCDRGRDPGSSPRSSPSPPRGKSGFNQSWSNPASSPLPQSLLGPTPSWLAD